MKLRLRTHITRFLESKAKSPNHYESSFTFSLSKLGFQSQCFTLENRVNQTIRLQALRSPSHLIFYCWKFINNEALRWAEMWQVRAGEKVWDFRWRHLPMVYVWRYHDGSLACNAGLKLSEKKTPVFHSSWAVSFCEFLELFPQQVESFFKNSQQVYLGAPKNKGIYKLISKPISY